MKYAKLIKLIFAMSVISTPTVALAEYTVSTLDLSDARALITKGETTATTLKVNVCLAVVDPSGILISFDRMDKAPIGCIDAAIAKARAAALYRLKTSVNMQRVNNDNPALATSPQIAPLGGGVPVSHGDQMVGAVGVSGATNEIEVKIAEKMAAGYGVAAATK